MINRIKWTPQMQGAYLNYANRLGGAGFVNPQIQAKEQIGSSVRSESQRLRAAEDTGHRLKSRELDFQNNMRLRQKTLNMKRDELNSINRGNRIGNLIGLGTLGMGAYDAHKTNQLSKKQSQLKQQALKMRLEFLKETNPKMYTWMSKQPYIKSLIDEYKIGV